ncbi:MAG: hypothetical protein CMH26_00010 [Micavibrio sp.]|jgi:catechol 2,3-dioxygenase-like lactoylglutathione lyase family enzyme|nr:hypothetical protein [Micavibrio sp.]|tara:strand:+ start:177 stop:596 length:420 start_codon:yes stop_codon:yes gene_type:complete
MSKHNDPKLIPELICSDFSTSLYFYTETLGFSVKYDRPEEGFAMLEFQGAMLMIDEIRVEEGKRSWITAPLEKPYGRGINLQIEVSDINHLYERLKAKDIPLFMDIEDKEYNCDGAVLVSRQFIVQDPDGYLLRFFEEL